MKKSLFTSLAIIICLFNVFSQSSINKFVNNIKVPLKKYKVTDINFTLKKLPKANPFDVLFGATVTGMNNYSCNIRGYYNGNNEWVIRFSANTTGIFSFTTYSSEPELSGLTGTINVTENNNPDSHWGISINKLTPQNFTFEDGTTYFGLAFELDWLFALDYKNKQDIHRTRQIIKDIKDNGFNQVVMNVYAYDIGWKTDTVPPEYEYRKPDFFPFKGSNEKPDFTGLNVDFFEHFDRVIQHLDEQGIAAHIMIYVWNKKVKWPDMNTWADNLYFDYVISRYQAFTNVIWDISKEALDYGRCDIPYINERISRIRKGDNFHRLITVHDYEYCSREPDKIDFISVQNWRSNILAGMKEIRKIYRDKPVMNIEHGGYEKGPYRSFEGNYTNPETCLIRNYECAFAGVYSTYYWQNTSWNIVIYDPLRKGQAFSPPRFDYYKHMRALFTEYDFNTLFPPGSKLTTNGREGLNNLSTNGFPLTNGDDLFLFLVPSEAETISTIVPEPASGLEEVTWFNPFTGEYIEKGKTPWSAWKEFKSPWKNTCSVLIIKLVK